MAMYTIVHVQPSQEESLTKQQMHEIIRTQVKELQEKREKEDGD